MINNEVLDKCKHIFLFQVKIDTLLIAVKVIYTQGSSLSVL